MVIGPTFGFSSDVDFGFDSNIFLAFSLRASNYSSVSSIITTIAVASRFASLALSGALAVVVAAVSLATKSATSIVVGVAASMIGGESSALSAVGIVVYGRFTVGDTSTTSVSISKAVVESARVRSHKMYCGLRI
jgi:hypothetical protein